MGVLATLPLLPVTEAWHRRGAAGLLVELFWLAGHAVCDPEDY